MRPADWGSKKSSIERTVYDLLVGECEIEECLITNVQENLDLLPSNVDLAGAEIELLEIENKETLLKTYLEKNQETL